MLSQLTSSSACLALPSRTELQEEQCPFSTVSLWSFSPFPGRNQTGKEVTEKEIKERFEGTNPFLNKIKLELNG